MAVAADRARPQRRRRLGRVLWPLGWVVLVAVSGTVAYLLLVIAGR